MTVDGSGNVYIGDATGPYRFMVFDSEGNQVSQFGAGQVIGEPGNTAGISTPGGQGANALAVEDASGTLYVASSSSNEDTSAVQAFPTPDPGPLIEELSATDLLPTTATLRASVNPEGEATEYRFEYVSQQGYEEQGNSFEGPATVREPDPDGDLAGTEFDSEELEAPLTGLIPATTYRYRLIASNPDGLNEEEGSFATRATAGIEAQWASQVAAASATLNASLDPLGAETTWWVEYGKGEALERKTPERTLPAGFGPVHLSAPVAGLEPATRYGYRFVAESKREGVPYVAVGEPRAFTTDLAGVGSGLPDGRAWEMVSPPNKAGGRIGAPEGAQGGHVQAAASGEALAYLSLGSVVADPEGNRIVEASSILARRGAGGAWGSEDITPPHTEATPFRVGSGAEYKLLSGELERALLVPRDCTALAPGAGERTPYLRHNAQPPAYTPLISAANVWAGAPPFGGDCGDINGEVSVRGASADLGHVVLGSGVPLAEGATPGGLYEWSGGALEQVSVLPEGKAAVSGELGSGEASVKNAVSAEGRRVFWSASSGGLYVRDSAREQSARLDEVQPGGFGVGPSDPRFQGASAEGSVAFFTDTHQLTEDSGEDGADLYRCEIVVAEGELGCELDNLSGEAVTFGQSSEVQGLLPGIGEDGTRAYLVARGVLDEAPNGQGQSATRGEPNLYAWREGEGMRFVATLGEGDRNSWDPSGVGGIPPASNRPQRPRLPALRRLRLAR